MRKKNVKAQVVIGLLVLGGLAACKKDGLIDVGPRDEMLREVVFRIKPFETRINPLMSQHSAYGSLGMAQVSEGNVSPSENEQMLYLWTFNQESLVPDIGIDTLGTEISATYNGNGKQSFVGGYSFPPLITEAGKAISFSGPKEIIFKMPITEVSNITKLRFDASASNKGPNDFIISYSTNNQSIKVIKEENNFYSYTGKNTFEYDLNWINVENMDTISFYLELKEGIRKDDEASNEYLLNSGTFRIDNFALTGIYTGPEIEPLNLGEGKIHYHIFNATDSILVQTGEKPINADQLLPELALKLTDGEYFVSFVANFSEETLIFPATIEHAKDLFLYQKLSDKTAVYGALLSGLEISADLTMDLEMERYFSEVNFEFTDHQGLDAVDKIEIESISKPFFSPYNKDFNPGIELMQQDDKITLNPEFDDSNTIRFFQFLGKTTSPKSVSYKLTAFGTGDAILREVTVNALINNNVQLSFIGNLLEGTGNINSGFRIDWKKEWGTPVNIGF